MFMNWLDVGCIHDTAVLKGEWKLTKISLNLRNVRSEGYDRISNGTCLV